MVRIQERRKLARTIALVSLAGLMVACGGDDSASRQSATGGSATKPAPRAPAAPPAMDAAQAAAEAEQIFVGRCVTCHGTSGGGDGPASKGLSPHPRDFRNPDWQAEVSDDHIAQIVMYGGAAVGRSPTMPGNPDLSSKPEVVAALVTYVRELRSN